MATVIDGIQFDSGLGSAPPRITFLQGCNMNIPSIRATLRKIEESEEGRYHPGAMSKNRVFNGWIVRAGGNFEFSDVESSALSIEVCSPFTMKFEAGAIPFQTDTGSLLGTFEESPGAIVQINNAVGATNIQSDLVEHSIFNGGVTLDVVNGTSGTEGDAGNPIGTSKNPSNNMVDTLTICAQRGFSKIYLASNVTLSLASENVSNKIIIGGSHILTTFTIGSAPTMQNVVIEECEISGVLDGVVDVRRCGIQTLTDVNGHIIESDLYATITLGPSGDTLLEDCNQGDIDTVPVINMGGSGQNLVATDYSGDLKLTNLTGANTARVGFDDGGTLILDSATVTAGTVIIEGKGVLEDESGNAIPSGTWNGGVTIENNVQTKDDNLTFTDLLVAKEV